MTCKKVCENDACECDVPSNQELNRINFYWVLAEIVLVFVLVAIIVWTSFKLFG